VFRNTQELKNEIRAAGLDHIEDEIVSLAKPAVQIIRERVEDEDSIPVGHSKMGGKPDLPVGTPWPHWGDKPLTFIAQFRLSEFMNSAFEEPLETNPNQLTLWDLNEIPINKDWLYRNTLPPAGYIYFFYDVDEMPFGYEEEERYGSRILYVESEATPLQRVSHPSTMGQWRPIRALSSHVVRYMQKISVPFFDTIALDIYYLLRRYPKEYAEETQYKYHNFIFKNWQKWPNTTHFILGYAMTIQGPAEAYAATDSTQLYKENIEHNRKPENWQFLFQIDSDDSLGVMWGDAGNLYVCIPKSSLRDRQFKDCWTIGQCH